MTNLELDPTDVGLLSDALRSYLNDLHDEIVHTENFDFRAALQEKQRRLNAILGRLGGQGS